MLDHKKPERCGLTENQLQEKDTQTTNEILEVLDTNWMSSKTKNLPHRFMDSQVASDARNRMENHWLSLDEMDEKLDFLMAGEFDNSTEHPVFADNGAKVDDVKGFTVYTNKEKEQYKSASADFFKPLKEDDSPDVEEFEHRINAIVEKVTDLRAQQVDFVKNGDFSNVLDQPASLDKKKDAARMINPHAIKALALESVVRNAVDEGRIDKSLMKAYCEKKGAAPGDLSDGSIASTFKNMFGDQLKQSMIEKLPGKKEDVEIVRVYGNDRYTEEENKKCAALESKVKRGIAGEIRAQKVWMHPENNISMEPLKKMDNLYDQFRNADSKAHWNSGKYEALRDALKEAHDKYEELSRKGGNLSAKDKADLVDIYDRIVQKSSAYLDKKDNRERKTDLGKERYDIAFAALNASSHGEAKRTAHTHNVKHVSRSARTVSLQELTERTNRTNAEQKAHEKAVKEAAKQRRKNIKPEEKKPELS